MPAPTVMIVTAVDRDGVPLAGRRVEVMTIDLTISTVTDSTGVSKLVLPPGTYHVAFAEGGPHQAVHIVPGQVEARVNVVAER